MADPNLLHSNSSFTSDPLRQEDEATMALAESKLRTRLTIADFPNIENVGSKYDDLILSLPVEEHWGVRQYQGFWVRERTLRGIFTMQEAFVPRLSDIYLASVPKSGTTWLKGLLFTIAHRSKYSTTSSNHPLLELNSHDCVPHVEFAYALRDVEYLDNIPSPRVLGTHAPYSLLPDSIKSSKCPIIYICREPKDVLVSMWHMRKMLNWPMAPASFAQAFDLFCEGRVMFGPIWDHVLEYYKESLQSPDKIMFLRYEEMKKNPIDGVIKLANFIGVPFSQEEKENGAVEKIVQFCSFDNLKSLNVNKAKDDEFVGLENQSLFRKAIVGDWENHMTAEMAAKLDDIVKEKLQDSGLSF